MNVKTYLYGCLDFNWPRQFGHSMAMLTRTMDFKVQFWLIAPLSARLLPPPVIDG